LNPLKKFYFLHGLGVLTIKLSCECFYLNFALKIYRNEKRTATKEYLQISKIIHLAQWVE